MPDYDGSVRIGVIMDTGQAEKELKGLSGDLDNAVGGAGKLADKLKSALATASFCFSPPESRAPLRPIWVFAPSGIRPM